MGKSDRINKRNTFHFSLLSLAYRIHSSESTADLLEQIGGFRMEFRGVTEIKVKDKHLNMCSRIINELFHIFFV